MERVKLKRGKGLRRSKGMWKKKRKLSKGSQIYLSKERYN